MTENHKITKAATTIGTGTFLSRVLGFLRDMVIANFFGAGLAADAFFVAFRLPNLWRRLVGEGSLTISLAIWIFAKQPVISVILLSLTDMLAFVPTIRKSWNKPHTETLFSYQMNTFRFVLALIALHHYTIITTRWWTKQPEISRYRPPFPIRKANYGPACSFR